jgi:hypothetical protein
MLVINHYDYFKYLLIQSTYILNGKVFIPFVIPHQDKSNFVIRVQYGSNEVSIS